MKRFVVVISGKQRSGKDKVAKLINAELGYRWKIVSLAEPIKRMYAKAEGITLEELENRKNHRGYVRNELIRIAKDLKSYNQNCFVKEALETEGNLIIPDCRYHHELAYINDAVGEEHTLTLRVESPREERVRRGILSMENDRSETDLDGIEDWMWVIDNDGDIGNLIMQCGIVADSIRSLFNLKEWA